MIVAVKVIPRASKSEVVGPMPDGSLKIRVKAVPEKGKANEEVCRLLAQHFKVPRNEVEVIAGQTGQQKRVRVGR